MTSSTFIFSASTLLVMSAIVTTAQECSPEVSKEFFASIHSTYFKKCAKDTTFKIKSTLDVFNLTGSDLATFCNTTTCIIPINELISSLHCNITYEGKVRNLTTEVWELAHKCSEVPDETEGNGHAKAADMDGTAGSSTFVNSGASSIVLMTGSVISAAILAVFLA